MTLRLGSTLISGVGLETKSNSNTLLSFKWSDHIINSMEWLRADTFSWQSGSVYTGVYQHLVADMSGATEEIETIGSYTITYYTATDGHKYVLADQEDIVNNIFNESGIAWYYIIDTANTRFKLPRSSTNHGELIENGVSGTNWYRVYSDGWVEQGGIIDHGSSAYDWSSDITFLKPMADTNYECFVTPSQDSGSGCMCGITQSTKTTSGCTFWQSSKYSGNGKSQYIFWEVKGYGSETPVNQFLSQYKYLYFYVGEFSQSATEQTAGITTEQLDQKVDISSLSECFVVIESKRPTAEDPTWYRVYSDGWVEQGGLYSASSSAGTYYITLPKEMEDTNYSVIGSYNQVVTSDWTANTSFNQYSTTQLKVSQRTTVTGNMSWEVKGMGASS